jgi:multicomponent Na+:H+ antiporter subunit E
MKTKITLFIISFIIWVFLDWPPDIQHALIGLLVAGLVIFLTRDIFTQSLRWGPIRTFLGLGACIPYFFWECLKTNADFILRLLHPKLPVNPAIVKVKTTLKTDIGLTFLANLLMLSSRGVCIDIAPEKDILYLHWIDTKPGDPQVAAQLTVDKFEKKLKMVFD